MTLGYPSPAAFAQALRFRLQATPINVPVVVVEGLSDRRAFGRILHPEVRVVPAQGKETVLNSRQFLTDAERARCTLIIDCDGEVSPNWLECDDVIVSTNRDLEADLIIELRVMHSVAYEYLAPLYDNGTALGAHVSRLEGYVLEFASLLGLVLDAARRRHRRVRVTDPRTLKRRRVQVSDLPEASSWLADYRLPSANEVAEAVGARVGWSGAEQEEIIAEAAAGGGKLCRRHGRGDCRDCKIRRFGNGHDIVDIAAIVLTDHAGHAVAAGEVARAMRIALGVEFRAERWSVVERLVRRERAIGLPIVSVRS